MKKQTAVEYWFDKSQTIRKSIILYKQIGSVASPIMYFSKPKNISNDEFMKIFNQMQIHLKTEL